MPPRKVEAMGHRLLDDSNTPPRPPNPDITITLPGRTSDNTLVDSQNAAPTSDRPSEGKEDELPSPARIKDVVAKCELEVLNDQASKKIGSQLGTILRRAARELKLHDPARPKRPSYPHTLLVEVLSKARIRRSLDYAGVDFGQIRVNECIDQIAATGQPRQLGRFGRIFAHLALCNAEFRLPDFFSEGIDDSKYPFDPDESYFPGDMTDFDRESFVMQQGKVFLPCFGEPGFDQEFEKDIAMPWISFGAQNAPSSSSTAGAFHGSVGQSGGYSDVSKVMIYDGHHKLSQIIGTGPKCLSECVAVKKLKTKDVSVFNKEKVMLQNLGGRKHTVTLLGTIRFDDTYALLFPWAKRDLLGYWELFGNPSGGTKLGVELVRWVSAQCCGLLTALNWIHNPGGEILDPHNKELYGRHGDIKPENILWYRRPADPSDKPAAGFLVLSDFGLSELNHKNTCTNVNNVNICHTPAYAPPESVLEDHKISRIIDIWALGCVYLEFITWILRGRKGIYTFQRERLSQSLPDKKIKSDIFWELKIANLNTNKPVSMDLRVKPKVEAWIESLRTDPRATRFIQEFLNIIQHRMLVVDKKGRETSEQLVPRFKNLDNSCRLSSEYCTAPVTGNQQTTTIVYPPMQSMAIPLRHLSAQVQRMIAGSQSQSASQLKPFRENGPTLRP